jgi:protein-L-isoaspartate O-methyltransferase
VKNNAIISSALETRIDVQHNQTLNLNEWIFDQLKIEPSDSVLELCCGTGVQTSYFSKKIKRGSLDCVDINIESINLNKDCVQDPGINYIVSSLDDINKYATKEYDLIFCAYGFYYSLNTKELHDALKEKLKHGGKFVLVGPTLGNNAELYRIVGKLGFDIPNEVIYSSERFMLDFLDVFIGSYNNVKFIRVVNEINYSTHAQLLKYWKNTTFYTSCPDEAFLAESKIAFEDQVTITKSIAFLEGSV